MKETSLKNEKESLVSYFHSSALETFVLLGILFTHIYCVQYLGWLSQAATFCEQRFQKQVNMDSFQVAATITGLAAATTRNKSSNGDLKMSE